MHTFAAAGAAFLLAVLWFDLMFDVQTRKRVENPLPPELLASISAYYRRVTTDAYPMNRLVALIMVLTLLAIGAEIVEGRIPGGSDGLRWHLPEAVLSPRSLVPSRTPGGSEADRIPPKNSRLWRARSTGIIGSALRA